MSYVSRWIKENPENIYQVKLTNGKFIAQISINEIVLFESSEDDLHRCVYILENDVRRHYEKTGRVEDGIYTDVNELLRDLGHLPTASEFEKKFHNLTFNQITAISKKNKPTFEDLSNATSNIVGFVLAHLRKVQKHMAEQDKTIDELFEKNESMKGEK